MSHVKSKKFDNVWFAIEANEADAVNMTMRSDLMTSIEKAVGNWKLRRAKPPSASASPARA